MTTREDIRKKIVTALDSIEAMMKEQIHITDRDKLFTDLDYLEKMFTVLTEDEKDFVGAVRYAIRTKVRWD